MTNTVTLDKGTIQTNQEKVFAVQEYKVKTNKKLGVEFAISFDHYDTTILTREEILEETLGYLSENGIDLSTATEDWVYDIEEPNENKYHVLFDTITPVNIKVTVDRNEKADWTREKIIEEALTSLRKIDLQEADESWIKRIDSVII